MKALYLSYHGYILMEQICINTGDNMVNNTQHRHSLYPHRAYSLAGDADIKQLTSHLINYCCDHCHKGK